MLEADADFLDKIREKDEWEKDLQPGGKYYFTRHVWILPPSII
jgi:hypothetical protein